MDLSPSLHPLTTGIVLVMFTGLCLQVLGLFQFAYITKFSWWFFTNPSEKYARSSNWIMKPHGSRGGKKIKLWNHHLFEIPFNSIAGLQEQSWFQVKKYYIEGGVPSRNPFFWVETRAVSRQKNPSSAVSCDHVSHVTKIPPRSRVQNLEFPKFRSGLVPSVADCFAKMYYGDKSASLNSKAILKLYWIKRI